MTMKKQLTEMKKIDIIFSIVLINVSIGFSQAHVFHFRMKVTCQLTQTQGVQKFLSRLRMNGILDLSEKPPLLNPGFPREFIQLNSHIYI